MKGPVRNAGYLFAGEAASRVFGFLTTALLARRLGVDGFGQIGFAAAMMAYGVAFTDLGLMTVGTRSIARDRAQTGELVGSLVPLRLLLSLAAAGLMVLIALVLPKPASVKWLLVLYAGAVIVQSIMLEWVFTGAEQMAFVSLSRIVTTCGYFGLVLTLVRRPDQLILVPVSFGIASALGALVLFASYAPRFDLPRAFGSGRWRELLTQAWPIGASTLLTQLHVNLGLILLGLIATYQQTGVYNSAYRLVFFLMTLDRVFYTVYFPVVTRFLATQPERLAELTGTAARMILALSLPMCAGASILGRQILALVYGAGYVEALAALRIMVWFLPLSMFNSLAGYTLLAAGKERVFLRNTVIGVGVAVVFNLVAVQLLGAAGAALGIVCGEAALLVLMGGGLLRLVRPRLEMRTLAPVVAAAAMAGVVFLLRGQNLALSVGFGALTYSVLLILLRGITPADLGMVRNP